MGGSGKVLLYALTAMAVPAGLGLEMLIVNLLRAALRIERTHDRRDVGLEEPVACDQERKDVKSC